GILLVVIIWLVIVKITTLIVIHNPDGWDSALSNEMITISIRNVFQMKETFDNKNVSHLHKYGKRVLSYKGLFVTSFGTKSHYNFYSGIINSLATEGHEITVVTLYDMKFKETSVKQIVPEDNISQKLYGNLFSSSGVGLFFNFLRYTPEMCINSLQTFLQREESKERI
ncbi:hypothetical protein Anas_08217, partial [Armadillidium nasatum]